MSKVIGTIVRCDDGDYVVTAETGGKALCGCIEVEVQRGIFLIFDGEEWVPSNWTTYPPPDPTCKHTTPQEPAAPERGE